MVQTILVTGSNSGFGRMVVEKLARQGATVFAAMREMDSKNKQAATELHTLAKQEHLALDTVNLDVTDDTSVQQAVDYIIQKSGRIDVVVNNAGISASGPLDTFSIAQIQKLFETNVFSIWRINHAVIPYMKAQKSGLLIQMGSLAGRLGLPFIGAYSATKFALEALTESYRYELAAFGIDSVIVEPGTYPTELATKRLSPEESEKQAPYTQALEAFRATFYAENNSATPPDPQEVANAVIHLIAMPAGTRPLHTAVAPASQHWALQEINTTAERVTRQYLENLGVLPLLTLTEKK